MDLKKVIVLSVILIILSISLSYAVTFKTIFNPFTSKLDYYSEYNQSDAIIGRNLTLNNTICASGYVLTTDGNGFLTCVLDATAAGGTSIGVGPWLYNISNGIYFNSSYSNSSNDLRYILKSQNTIPSTNVTGGYTMPWANVSGFPGITGLAINTNYSFPGVTGLAINTNYTFPGVSGLVLGTNYTFAGSTGLAINTNYTFPGLTAIPRANITGLSVIWGNVTNFPGLTGLTLGTNVTWTGLTGIAQSNLTGITIPNTNVTGGWTLPSTNITGGYTMPWNNVSGFPGITGLTLGTNYTFQGVTGLAINTNYSFPGVTGLVLGTNYSFSGVTGLTINTNYSFPGVTVPLGNLTGSTSQNCTSGNYMYNVTISSGVMSSQCRADTTGSGAGLPINMSNITNLPSSKTCSSTDKMKNVTLNDSGLFIVCETDQTSAGGSGLVPFWNVTYFNVSSLSQANFTGMTWPWANITSFPGLTGLAINTNYTFPGVTGLAIGTNYTFGGSTGLAINTNYSFPGLTGLTINTNYTFPGVTGLTIGTNYTFNGITNLPQANLSGITLSAGNLTNNTFTSGNWTFNINSNLSSPKANFTSLCLNGFSDCRTNWGTTGLTLGTNYTFGGITNLPQANLSGIQLPSTNITGGYTMPWANVSGFPGVTGLAINTNYTFPGVTGLAINTNYTFPGVTLPIANLTNGTFASGNWIFPNNLTVQQNFSVNDDFFVNATGNTMRISANITANITYQSLDTQQVCYMRFKGTQYNHTICLNSTGHSIETIGVFAL